MKKALFILLSTIFLSNVSWAADDNYVSVQAGVSVPIKKMDISIEKDYPYKGRIDNSATFGASFGKRIYNDLFGELEYTYIPKGSLSQTHNFVVAGDPASVSALSKVESQSLLANLNYLIKTDFLPFTPYVTTGAGIAYNKIKNINSTMTMAGMDPITSTYKGHSQTNFAWQVGVGGLFQLTNSLDLDVAIKYKDLGKVKSSLIDLTNNAVNSSTPVKGRLSAVNFTLGLKFKF